MLDAIKKQFKIKKDAKKLGLSYSIPLVFISKNYGTNQQLKYWRLKAKNIGYLMTENAPGNMFNEILVDKVYDVDQFKPKKDDIVVDIGAYYGDSAIWWAKEFKANVIAFEPLPEAYRELLENAKLNKVEDKIKAYNVALGNGNDITGGKGKGTMFNYSSNEKTINTKKLDDFAFDRIDILKIDVEGFELEVLKGSEKTIKRLKPKIILETHSRELRRKCDDFLKKLGYHLKVEGRTALSKQKGFDEITNLFYDIDYSPTHK